MEYKRREPVNKVSSMFVVEVLTNKKWSIIKTLLYMDGG